jgi:hypothetical protein
MNRKQFRKQVYVQPTIEIIATQQEHLLVASGQHENAGHGGTIGNAKQGLFDEDEEEDIQAEEQGYHLWNE